MKYSIITPVYNREDCIARCLDSVISNTRADFDFEHIVVDDGSSDRSALIIQEYAEKYKHIKYISFSQNRGTNAARNAAIAAAESDYCIILDSDDYFVADALAFIDSIVSSNEYKAYMFAADDMLDYYKRNPIINGKLTVELTFQDFLRGSIGGDFIHCICTQILKKYPFDEGLKVFEAVFFLRFFREAQKMLFTNRVVTIRERSRNDSVTRTMIATNEETIQKYYQANQYRYLWFKNDYVRLGEVDALSALLNNLVYYSLLLGLRDRAKKWVHELQRLSLSLMRKNHILFTYRLGRLYLFMLKVYFVLKYKILQCKLS
uniref:glycosyltransferase family 2 protein n=1 Tax=Alistipes sp. Marseille-P5061 TaxID=2048242 RepID=UPI000D0E9310|nr:glycosyltransferase family 2 protein [Alistipes sp. Marseille-P5061]